MSPRHAQRNGQTQPGALPFRRKEGLENPRLALRARSPAPVSRTPMAIPSIAFRHRRGKRPHRPVTCLQRVLQQIEQGAASALRLPTIIASPASSTQNRRLVRAQGFHRLRGIGDQRGNRDDIAADALAARKKQNILNQALQPFQLLGRLAGKTRPRRVGKFGLARLAL